jgi:hypothetical protein
MMNKVRDGFRAYFNVNSMELAWERPDSVRKDYNLITRDELQTCVSEVTSAHDRQRFYLNHERYIIKLQARIRGCLERKHVHMRLRFLKDQLPAVITIQVGLQIRVSFHFGFIFVL